MATLLIGFDSAWTATNAGAIVAALRHEDGSIQELGAPRIVDYSAAERAVLEWQRDLAPTATIVLLDQPTIVANATGQRPVENIVASAVSLRYGGMQPANSGRREMFGASAPIWPFLAKFGGHMDPFETAGSTIVLETYPVLTMIALGWLMSDERPTYRLSSGTPG